MRGLIPFPNISPEIFSISVFGFELALRWYALAYIVGIVLGWRLAVRAVQQPKLWRDDDPVMSPAQIEDLLTWIILGVILGGRLGYVAFYQPAYYLQNPSEILAIWQGGMAFHGGLLGVIVAGWIYTTRHQIAKLSAADVMALGVPPGLLLGPHCEFYKRRTLGATDKFAVGRRLSGRCGTRLSRRRRRLRASPLATV